MKFCMLHWIDLKKAISDRGLDNLIAKDGKAAMEMVKDNLARKGEYTKDNFDPLMAAHLSIMNNAVEKGGVYILNGDYCPLCEFKKHVKDADPNEWIKFASDEVLEKARKLNLTPKVN